MTKAVIEANNLINDFEKVYGLNKEKAIEVSIVVAQGKFYEYMIKVLKKKTDNLDTPNDRKCVHWENVVNHLGLLKQML